MTTAGEINNVLDLQQAKECVLEYLREFYIEFPDIAAQLVIDDARTRETEDEWFIYWNKKEYVETRDIHLSLIGAYPIAMSKKDGSLRTVKRSEVLS